MTNNYRLRGSLWNQPLLSLVQNHLISYPTPSNLTGNWNWGVLAGLCLVLQILTGIFLAMHYTAHVDLAFNSVQHLMRDVPYGWLLRYLHANGASLFFIVVYMHLFRGLYYTSYAQPREAVWLIGVVILLVMILTAFIGYVLPWGECLPQVTVYTCAFYVPKIPADRRTGPHNYDVLCLIYGALLGDAYAEKHGNGTRITFNHSSRQVSFLFWLQKFLFVRGYCTNKKPKITKQTGKSGKVYFSVKFHTFTFTSFNAIIEDFYSNANLKQVPTNMAQFLSPLALAVWIMMDGSYTGSGIKLHTERFSVESLQILVNAVYQKYNWVVTIHKKNHYNTLYIPARYFIELKELVKPYFDESMYYKLGEK